MSGARQESHNPVHHVRPAEAGDAGGRVVGEHEQDVASPKGTKRSGAHEEPVRRWPGLQVRSQGPASPPHHHHHHHVFYGNDVEDEWTGQGMDLPSERGARRRADGDDDEELVQRGLSAAAAAAGDSNGGRKRPRSASSAHDGDETSSYRTPQERSPSAGFTAEPIIRNAQGRVILSKPTHPPSSTEPPATGSTTGPDFPSDMPSVSPTARRTPAARPHPKLVLPSDKALGPTQLQALTQALLANSASTVVTKKPHRKSITGASLMPSSAEGSPAPPPKRSHKKRRVDSSSATSTFRRGLRDDNSDAASTQAGGSAEDTSGDETVREGDAGRSRRRSGTANRDRARHVGTGFDGEDFEDGDMEWNHDDGGDAGMETGDVDEEVEALTRELSFDPQTLLDDADTEAAVESATAKLQSRITELRARLSDSETVHEEMETCRYEMTELDREMDVVLAAIIRKAARSARHAARESVSQHPSVQESASSEPPNPASEQPTSNDEEEEEDDDDGLSEDKGGEGDAGTRRRMPRRPSPLVYPGSTTVWHPAFPFPIAPVETDEDEVLEETVFTTRLEREEVPVVLDFCRAVKARGHRLFNRLGHYLAARDDRQQDAGAGDAGRGDATDPSGLARDKKDAAAALDLLGLGQDHVAVPASAVGSVF